MAARKRKRSDGRYCVSVSSEDGAGIIRRHYVYGKTQAEANAKAKAAPDRLEAGAPVRDASRTLSDWLVEWRATYLLASDRARSTKSLYAGLTRNYVDPQIGSIPLDRLRPADVTRMLVGMEKAGMSGSTRRSAYAALRGALADAVDNELLGANPVEKVKRPRASTPEATSLTPDQVASLLRGAAGLRYAAVLRLILGTGLRRGEALALRWADVNLDRGEARITGSLVRTDGQLVVAETKTARSRRVVSLSPAMLALLTRQRAAQAGERLRAANLWADSGFVFTTEFGHPADPRNLLRAVKLASAKSGLGEIGVHTLRHTYATVALLNRVPLHVVSRNLGHSSIAITADIYGHLTDEASQAAAVTVSTALRL
jgi:integrase